MGRSSDISSSYSCVALTPNDSTTFPTVRGLYIGVSGDVAVTTAYGEAVTFKNVPVGIHPVQVTQVKSTGTTATDIIGLY